MVSALPPVAVVTDTEYEPPRALEPKLAAEALHPLHTLARAAAGATGTNHQNLGTRHEESTSPQA
jgi:hypothetical protein